MITAMQRLVTAEDRFHLHKALGLSALAHFAYRVARNFAVGDSGLAGSSWAVPAILAHAALSISSLQFHIPRNRVAKRPMIYPEFRAHSIIFGLRSITTMLILVTWPAAWWPRAAAILATMAAADAATAAVPPSKADTTMRGMPFGEFLTEEQRRLVNLFYAASQVIGTLELVTHDGPRGVDAALLVLIPIQCAAFMMTLVRKGLLSAPGWHLLYTFTLMLNYSTAAGHGLRSVVLAPWWPQALLPEGHTSHWELSTVSLEYWALVAGFCLARFRLHVNKYVLWGLVLAWVGARRFGTLGHW